MSSIKVSVFLGLSLDGFIAEPNGELDWLGMVETKPEETGYLELMSSVYCMVLGRNTCDSMLSFDEWPCASKRVIVLTTRPAIAKHGESFFNGKLSDLITKLEKKRKTYLP